MTWGAIMADLIALKERYAGRNDSPSQGGGINVEAYLAHYGYGVKNIKANGTSTIYTLDQCPFDPNHAGGEASIIKTSEGKLLFQCFHDSCKGRTWKEARQIISGSDSLSRFMEGGTPTKSTPRTTKETATDNQDGEAEGQERIFKPYYEFDLTPPEFIIDDLIEENSLCNGYGDPGSAKSLFWTEAGFCTAAALPFYGREVKQGTVVMFVGEGMQGVLRRLRALEIKYGVMCPPFYITSVSAALSDPGSCEEMIPSIQEVPGPIRMIIIDTLARNFGGGNENSTQDMNVAVHNLDEIRRHCGSPAVIPIHHLGKTDKNTGRGSSVLRGAADTEYRFVKGDDEIIRVECTKRKDGEIPAPMAFRIGTVDIDMEDRKGRPVYPPVLYSIEYAPEKEPVRVGATEAAFLILLKKMAIEGVIPETDAKIALRGAGYSKQQIGATLKRMENKGFISRSTGNIRLNNTKGDLSNG